MNRDSSVDSKKVLFVCIHNSARSQMAEVFVNQLGGDKIIGESAGLEPGNLNPIVVEAMNEIGIDISGNQTKGVAEFLEAGKTYDYVITVCDEGNSERCPVFPGGGVKLHWPFDDPSQFEGAHKEKLSRTREVRDEIKEKIKDWIKNIK